MDRKKELKEQYKQVKPEAGIYKAKNNKNNKVFVAALPNLKSLNGIKFQLEMGSHMNKELQKEWQEFGESIFTIEVVEKLKDKEEGEYDARELREELKKLLNKWLKHLQPFTPNGYHDIKELED